ncbi:MAG: ParB N-terminal domain-containing protein [Staphylothermus sp.]|nr:ParB N-terminal domain-containing protein [Staphylothermus sp.]
MAINTPLTNRLKLSSRRDVERRLHEIIWILRDKYRDVRLVGEKRLDPYILYSTQRYLESDKLGLVLKEVLYRGYYVPITVVRGRDSKYYVIDGHHRARVYLWLRVKINAYVLDVPAYDPREKYHVWEIDLINPNEVIPKWLSIWKHMVNIIHFLEKNHRRIARLWREKLPIRKLIPTEKIYYREVPSEINEPILVYYYDDEYYVVDGHNRVCTNLYRGINDIEAVVFTLDTTIGLIETSKKIGLREFNLETCGELT